MSNQAPKREKEREDIIPYAALCVLIIVFITLLP